MIEDLIGKVGVKWEKIVCKLMKYFQDTIFSKYRNEV